MKKRKFLRFDTPLEANLFFDTESAQPLKTRILDFSREGMRISGDNLNELKNNRLKISIQSPVEEARKFLLEGHVCWESFNGEDKNFGVHIDKMDSSEKSELMDFVYRLWKSKIVAI